MNGNKMKASGRIIAVLLAALMVIAMIPSAMTQTFAETQETNVNDSEIAEVQSGTATVTVTAANATVVINGVPQTTYTADIGTEVPVKITPNKGAYIKSLTVGTNKIEVEKGKAYEGEILLESDIDITAEVVKEFSVTANASEGGTIKLNDSNETTLTVDEQTEVAVQVEAEEGYQISSVFVNNAAQPLDDTKTFKKKITVNENTVITAEFVKVYTVTVTCDENGEVEITDPKTAGGSVTVKEGSSVSIEAAPNENYRVSQVTINKDKDESVSGENDSSYTKTIKPDKDYEFVITFALNQYKITSSSNVKDAGVISSDPNPVDYGASTKVTVTSKAGYSIKSVKVKDKEGEAAVDKKNVEKSTTAESAVSFEIAAVKADKEVIVEYEEAAKAKEADFSFNNTDAVRTSGNLYVFKKDATVKFSTVKDGLKIYKYNDKGELELVGGAWDKNFVEIKETTSIGKISIYYQADGEYGNSWHDFEYSKDAPLKIVIETGKPEAEVVLDEKAAKPSAAGWFNEDVVYTVKASDAGDDYSGIASIKYEVGYYKTEQGTTKFETTQSGTLYEYASGEIKQEIEETFTVTAADNNRDDVVVRVTVADLAGNVWDNYHKEDGSVEDQLKININSTAPTAVIKVENEKDSEGKEKQKSEESVEDGNYYNMSRTAAITYTDRETTFDKDAALAGITVTAKDAKGNNIEGLADEIKNSISWGDYDTEKGTITATISFAEDANYEWSIEYTNKADLGLADNKEGGITTEGDHVFGFAVDKTAPTASISAKDKENEEITWKDLITPLAYKIYRKTQVDTQASGEDATTGIQNIRYYKSNEKEALAKDELEKIFTDETKYSKNPISVNSNEEFVVYSRITDLAGNSTYVGTNGIIYDSISPEVSVTASTKQNENGYYNGDVKLSVSVNEELKNVAYSGIKEISYVITAQDTGAKESGKFDLQKGSAIGSNDVIKKWDGTLTIDSKKFNSNSVSVVVNASDNAGNETTKTLSGIKIDVTAPVIDIAYDNNNADNAKYFNKDRTATIVVTERNFNPDDVQIKITNTDGVIPKIGKWTKTEGTGNKDNAMWTAAITYSADGDYTFDINYTDLAGNKCTSKRYGNSVAPTAFTVDKTAPVVSVSYSNNNARNEKYFDAPRTATIVVNEHNFDVNRVEFTQTAALNGANIDIPAAAWSNNGDIHTATIVYDRDGDYTFDVSVKDMAANETKEANYADSAAAKDFVIDQTIEDPIIGGVKDGGAYKGDAVPTISFGDINYDSYEVRLLRTSLGKKNVDVTAEFIKGITENAQGGEGSFDTFEKIVANDGIYTLIVKVVDKAGHEATKECTFTLNRFGSVYEYSDDLVDLIKDGGQYVTSVNEDLVITEYNATKILKDSLKLLVTRDGESVDVDYTSNPANINAQASIGESGWYQYVYTIKASNFEQDGVYKISLASKYSADDSVSNESTSVPENSTDEGGKKVVDAMTFTVDSAAPEIRNIVNLEKKIVDKDKIVDGKLNVKYTVVDVGGLKSIEVIVNDKTVQTLNKEDIGDGAYNFTGSFDIEEQSGTAAQKVRIKATDLAGNVTDTDSAEFLAAHSSDNSDSTFVFCNEVTVSRNFFVRWYANKALFWGIIGAVVVIAAAMCFIVAAKRRKKSEEE